MFSTFTFSNWLRRCSGCACLLAVNVDGSNTFEQLLYICLDVKKRIVHIYTRLLKTFVDICILLKRVLEKTTCCRGLKGASSTSSLLDLCRQIDCNVKKSFDKKHDRCGRWRVKSRNNEKCLVKNDNTFVS